jgi:hypothetical protein
MQIGCNGMHAPYAAAMAGRHEVSGKRWADREGDWSLRPEDASHFMMCRQIT